MSDKSSHFQSIGQAYNGFKVVKIREIPELQCVLRELEHEKTGAHVMHIANEDPENVFCLSFQTLPENSNGVAHILEHTVLCGSKKYPIKDPFFAMGRRSLNTFMNAFTGSDFTCYPAATQVPQDFYNLLEVYLDAVFHPNLKELSFLQEGHRLEFCEPTDPLSPLEYKGIVYNEMKGVLASSSARLAEEMNANLFPDITYGVNSGGDPKVIPQLTYSQLKEFHQKYYHPSRCLFYFYGNMPLEEHLDFIASHALNKVSKASSLPAIPLQARFTEPRHRVMHYPISSEEDPVGKTLISFGWLTCHILDQGETLALNVLEIILMDNDASPLKMALLKSGLCKQASSFMDAELTEIPWGVTLRGCRPEDADPLGELIKSTLLELVDNGIPTTMIENAIHQLEFHRTEITGDHIPFGLSLFMRSGLLKQHGADPTQGLMIHSLFDQLRKSIHEDPGYLGKLILKHFIHNKHHVRIVMIPDAKLGAEEVEEEKRQLEAVRDALSIEQKRAIIDKAAELTEFQKLQEEEDIEVLPKVSIQDVPEHVKKYPLVREKVGNLEVFHHSVFTNQIVYADLVFDLPDLAEDDIPLFRLLTIVLTQMGCKGRSYQEQLELIQGNTGGVGAGVSLNLNAHDSFNFHPTFHLRGKALERKAESLFPLMQEILTATDLRDEARLKEIILKHFTALESRLNQSALKYAINLSARGQNVASKMADDLYGMNYFWKLRDIATHIDAQGPAITQKLIELQQKIMAAGPPHLVLTCDAESYAELKQKGFYGLKDFPVKPLSTPWKGQYALPAVTSQARVIASPVAFVGNVFPTVSYTHPHAPALNIAAFLFDNVTLHKRIREQGGGIWRRSGKQCVIGEFLFLFLS